MTDIDIDAIERRAKAATESVRRLVNSHFNNPDRARASIPARPDYDDDIIASSFMTVDIPALIAALRERDKHIEQLRTALAIEKSHYEHEFARAVSAETEVKARDKRIAELERVLRFEIVGWREHDRREGQSPLDYVVEAALAALEQTDG